MHVDGKPGIILKTWDKSAGTRIHNGKALNIVPRREVYDIFQMRLAPCRTDHTHSICNRQTKLDISSTAVVVFMSCEIRIASLGVVAPHEVSMRELHMRALQEQAVKTVW